MKKTIAFLLALILMGCCASALAGCELHPEAEDYEQNYYFEVKPWNENFHIYLHSFDVFCAECHAWVDGGDYEVLVEHDFRGDRCTDCDYVKNNQQPSPEELMKKARQRITADPAAFDGKTASVIHDGNLRAQANGQSEIAGKVLPGEEYKIATWQADEKENIWLQIEYGAGYAWVSASLVEISGENALTWGGEYYIDRMCGIKVSSGRARLAPGTEYPVVGYVSYGQTYKIRDCKPAADNTLWFMIRLEGKDAWISSTLADIY